VLGLALGIAFLSGFGLGATALVFWLGLGSLALARRGLSIGVVVAIAVATITGAAWARTAISRSEAAFTADAFEGVILISDGPFLTRSGQRVLARPERFPSALLCAYASADPRPLPGDRVFVSGRITGLEDLSQLGVAAARTKGCTAQLRIESMQIVTRGRGIRSRIARERVALSDWLMRIAPGDTGALLSGLVTGDDGGLSQGANQAFLTSGTTHITAISGANFATFTLLLGVLATGAMRRNVLFVTGASLVIWLYALMVGLEPSAFRAALLATAVLIGRWIGRRPDLLTLTVLLAAVQIMIRPTDFSTLAFQLSLAATVALIIVFDGAERTSSRSRLANLGLTVLAAQLATIPILAWSLGTMTGIGLLANLVVGPLAGLAFPIALVGSLAGRVVPIVGDVIAFPAIWICRLMLVFVEWSDRRLPGIVQLGEPTPAAMLTISLVCWLTIFWMSGDLRRLVRHGMTIVRSW